MQICQIILTPQARLSRSLKVTGTNTDRSATYDFLIVFRRSSTISEIEQNLQIFLTFLNLTSDEGVALEFCNALET